MLQGYGAGSCCENQPLQEEKKVVEKTILFYLP